MSTDTFAIDWGTVTYDVTDTGQAGAVHWLTIYLPAGYNEDSADHRDQFSEWREDTLPGHYTDWDVRDIDTVRGEAHIYAEVDK